MCFAATEGRLEDSLLFARSFGGAEVNTSVGLARLGDSVTWISRVSDDAIGEHILNVLDREGVDLSQVSRSETGQTGLIVKDRPSPHESRWMYYREESAATELSPELLDPGVIERAELLHVTGITMSIGAGPLALTREAVRIARENGVLVTFDPNFRPQLVTAEAARATFVEMLPNVDHLLCNDSEAELITGLADPVDAALKLVNSGPSAVVIKQGVRGVTALVEGELIARDAVPAPHPIDPTGAGDAFNAGWIHSTLEDWPLHHRLALAAFVAAQVVQHPGDFDGFPDRATVNDWLAQEGVSADARR